MFAVTGDLFVPSPDPAIGGSEFWNYDVVIVNAGYHHFSDPDLAAKRLAERLRKGGVLVIVDMMGDGDKSDSQGHDGAHEHGVNGHGHGHDAKDHDEAGGDTRARDAAHTVAHPHGFSKSRMTEVLEAAGCVDVDYVALDEPLKLGGAGAEGKIVRKVFVAKGRRG